MLMLQTHIYAIIQSRNFFAHICQLAQQQRALKPSQLQPALLRSELVRGLSGRVK